MDREIYFIASSRWIKTLLTHYTQLIAHYKTLQSEQATDYRRVAYYKKRIDELTFSKKLIVNRAKKQLEHLNGEIEDERRP